MKRFFLLTLAAGTLAASEGLAVDNNPIVVIDTSLGKIKVELFPDKTPITVKNFLGYVDDKFFEGTIFHRVIPGFMIQGGGFEASKPIEPRGEKKTKSPIKNEASKDLLNKRGTIAMARTSVPDSATSQFFINLKDNAFLDKEKDPRGVGYCVFGKVIDGMDVVDKIAGVKTKSVIPGAIENVPVEPVVIKSIRRVDKEQDKEKKK
jgi:cyclophilin family peptidyl-prolyl cis-trans isomerase